MKKNIFLYLGFSFILFCCNRKDISGIYYLKEKNDSIVNDYCTKLILNRDNTYIYTNAEKSIYGEWKIITGEFIEVYLNVNARPEFGLYNLENGMTFEDPYIINTDTSVHRLVFEKLDSSSILR